MNAFEYIFRTVIIAFGVFVLIGEIGHQSNSKKCAEKGGFYIRGTTFFQDSICAKKLEALK